MIEPFIFKSENSNSYFYNNEHRLSLLIHPEFEKVYDKLEDSDPYYLKKYEYLRSHGLFAKSKLGDFGSLDEFMVKDSIANVNQIVFEVTDACNLSCTYCSLGELYEGFEERIGKKINVHSAISLLKYIFELKPKNKNSKLYISFYGGEALLNTGFIKQIVELSKKLNTEKGFELKYSMTTNATLIHKHIDFLVANEFILLVSLDGNEVNHSYRIFKKNKKNSFKKVKENMDIIQRYYPKYFQNNITFNAVLHNRSSIKEIFEFIYMHYHKIPRITELNLRDVKSDNKGILEKMFQSKRKSEIEYQKENSDLSRITHGELLLYKELINFLREYSINYYISNMNAILLNKEKKLPTNTCIPFSKKIFLTTRNKLLPCEKIKYSYSMGKINEKVEIDIPEITKQYNFYIEHIKKFCQTCYAYRFCGTCLFQMDNIDKVDTDKFVCERFQNQDNFKNKLNNIFSFLEKNPYDFSEIFENIIYE